MRDAARFTPESAKVVKKPYAEVIRESNPTPDAPSFPVTYTLKATPTVRIINEVTVSKAALKKNIIAFRVFFLSLGRFSFAILKTALFFIYVCI